MASLSAVLIYSIFFTAAAAKESALISCQAPVTHQVFCSYLRDVYGNKSAQECDRRYRLRDANMEEKALARCNGVVGLYQGIHSTAVEHQDKLALIQQFKERVARGERPYHEQIFHAWFPEGLAWRTLEVIQVAQTASKVIERQWERDKNPEKEKRDAETAFLTGEALALQKKLQDDGRRNEFFDQGSPKQATPGQTAVAASGAAGPSDASGPARLPQSSRGMDGPKNIPLAGPSQPSWAAGLWNGGKKAAAGAATAAGLLLAGLWAAYKRDPEEDAPAPISTGRFSEEEMAWIRSWRKSSRGRSLPNWIQDRQLMDSPKGKDEAALSGLLTKVLERPLGDDELKNLP